MHSIQWFGLSFHIVRLLYVIMSGIESIQFHFNFPSGMKHIFPIKINIVHTTFHLAQSYFEFFVLAVAQIPEFTPIHMHI